MTPREVAEQVVTQWWVHRQEELPAHECAKKCLPPMIESALLAQRKAVWTEAAERANQHACPTGRCTMCPIREDFRRKAQEKADE